MSVALYSSLDLTIGDLKRTKLPSFQRKLVWTQKKKEAFIETLRQGLPFGSILVYPEDQSNDSMLLVLDGQQRLSTILEYRKCPLRFWKPLNREDYQQALDDINKLLPEDKQLTEKQFDAFYPWGGSDDEDLSEYTNWFDEIESTEVRKAVRTQLGSLRRSIKSFIDLDNLKIPAIKFIGGRELIATVFSNLNQGGTPLSKYEIYNAAWVHTKIELLPPGNSELQDTILENVKRHYNDMVNNAEFELDGFSEDELTQSRTITLSEFGIALGMYVQKRLNALIPQSENTVAEIGFGLLGIAVGVDNRALSKLNTYTEEIDRQLQLILEKIDRICINLQDIFAKLLKRYKGKKNDEYMLGLSTTFKTLSYFAALWDLEPNSAEYRSSLENIKAYYLLDALNKSWSSHGDQRLLDYYPGSKKRNYLEPVEQERLVDAFDHWLLDATPGIQFNKEAKAITTIHANLTYLSSVVPNGDDYELEHIVPKKIINQCDDASNRSFFGSIIGNCMYLPRLDNNKKKDKTLYDVKDPSKYSALIKASLYPSKQDLRKAIDALKERDFETANRVVRDRSHRVAEAVAEGLIS